MRVANNGMIQFTMQIYSFITCCHQIYEQLTCTVEEVSMKWLDRPSVAEMERGGVYEMEIKNLLYPFM